MPTVIVALNPLLRLESACVIACSACGLSVRSVDAERQIGQIHSVFLEQSKGQRTFDLHSIALLLANRMEFQERTNGPDSSGVFESQMARQIGFDRSIGQNF